MRTYETMLLIDARLADADVEATVERFVALVTEHGGESQNIDRWGRRRLTHEVADQIEGNYVIVNYSLAPDKMLNVDSALPFVEGLIRSKTTIAVPKRPAKAAVATGVPDVVAAAAKGDEDGA